MPAPNVLYQRPLILTHLRWADGRGYKIRASELRPVQVWGPATRAAGFAAECRRQCEAIAVAGRTDLGRAETEFWERVTAGTWENSADTPAPEGCVWAIFQTRQDAGGMLSYLVR